MLIAEINIVINNLILCLFKKTIIFYLFRILFDTLKMTIDR